MTKVFDPPEEIGEVPHFSDFKTSDGKADFEAVLAAEEAWVRRLVEWCRATTDSTSELIGEIIHFPMGDGRASYVVYRTKPLSLIHVPTGDAWDLPDYMIRGLRVSDVKDMVNRERGLAEIFGRKS